MDFYNVPASNVIRHSDCTGTTGQTECPGTNYPWSQFKSDIGGSGTDSTSSGSSSSGAPRYGDDDLTFRQAHGDVWGDDGYEWLQEALNDLVNAGLTVDGVFGQNTLDATRDFQDMYNLSYAGADYYGVPGPTTQAKIEELQNGGSSSSGLPSGMLRRGDRGDGVRAVQEALVEANFYPDRNASNNGVDGIYGPDTENAVERFQSVYLSNEVDGIYGPNTREKLEEVM
ncbi:peptidoglycan-binding protein [Salicibibacter halophilus]|uniref:Peptidoglycan-binding protein n=2 Tax=Salicibibacter halophilus TaxID=2502791 RepID=A0A514LM67_9BACI|nr:peptidoglycan-binding protein [Salicibibacter halophilus]